MSERNICKKIMLSGQAGFRVHYCEMHRNIELEIGSISLRLDEHALMLMSDVLDESVTNLQALHATRASFQAFMRQFNMPD